MMTVHVEVGRNLKNATGLSLAFLLTEANKVKTSS